MNIEVGHIRQEAKGGSNDEENGIPVCFDCHQEVKSYNDDHPKGNKFREAELVGRRDRIYALVESGAIYAQVVARQLRQTSAMPSTADIDELVEKPQATTEAKRLLETLLSESPPDAPDRKIKLLTPKGKAFVLDSLLADAPGNTAATAALCRAATPVLLTPDDLRVTVEQLVRAVTLFGSAKTKAAALSNISSNIFAEVDEEIRLTLFQETVAIIDRDQFPEVNVLVPALEDHIRSIPADLQGTFGEAVLKHSWSAANQGAPAARRILADMPTAMAAATLKHLSPEFLCWYGHRGEVGRFISRHRQSLSVGEGQMLDDYGSLSETEFRSKYPSGV